MLPSLGTVMVVDDDEPLRILLEIYLRKFGYVPLLAEDGATALELAEAHPETDAIILDLVMGGISGDELAQELAARLPNAAMLFCSGHPPQELARLKLNVPIAQFMQKPCRPDSLRQHLEQIFAARAAA